MSKSKELYEAACKIFPGGVNSPVRAAVKPYPFYTLEAKGPYLITVDNVKLIDYVMAYGPLILGHSYHEVLKVVVEQLERGWVYGTPSKTEIELANKIIKYYKTDKVRFVNSGTEATLTAIRLARGFTGRDKIIKFNGCYHGSNDYLLVKAGSSALQYGIPSSGGIPKEISSLTYVLTYNDVESFVKFMDRRGDEVSSIIIEPIIVNSGLILPDRDFLEVVREEAEKHGVLLIFDEVVTGFRVALGGAQEYYGIKADITTLGKILGGGFPIGAVTSKEEIMDCLTPKGKVFNAGTFNAHPISMAAGLATINVIEKEQVYKVANRAAKELSEFIFLEAEKLGIDITINYIASMFQVFFTEKEVKRPEDVTLCNKDKYVKFHEYLLKSQVFIPPSQYETCFTSYAHTDEIIINTIDAIKKTLRKL